MRKLNSQETLLLMITLGLVLCFIVYKLVIRPMQEGASDIDDRIKIASHQILKARQIVAQKSSVEAQYQHLVNLIGVANADSEEALMPAIIAKIEAAARDSNIHIGNIQPQKSIVQKEARFLTVELEVDGQWLDLVQFFNSLQQEPNFYFINELNLEKYSYTTNALRSRIIISRMYLVTP